MHTVKINKAALLAKMKTNREAHKAEYDAACVEYRRAVVQELKDMLGAAVAGGTIKRAVKSPEPVSYVSSYDQVIAMLEMSIDDVIELDNHQFNQYVLDEWNWKEAVKFSNSAYLSK